MVAGKTRTTLLAPELFSPSRAWGSTANRTLAQHGPDAVCFSGLAAVTKPYPTKAISCRQDHLMY